MYSRWEGFFARVVISLVLTSVFVVSGVALVNRGINDRVHKIKRIAGLTVAPAPPGGANYLIIGSDTRAFATDPGDQEAFGDPNDPNTSGQRSDTLMVAHVEPGPQQTFVVSFPRDLMVDVPGLPGKNRINSAYASGGAQAVIETLKANFDIDINHYLEVDFKTFQKIVDTIGSVRVFLPGQIRDQETGLATGPITGCYALNGPMALAYVAAKHRDRRSERQHHRPGHRRALATTRPTGRPRPHRASAAVHPQAGGARHLQEPEQSHPGCGAHRQRPGVHQRGQGPEP